MIRVATLMLFVSLITHNVSACDPEIGGRAESQATPPGTMNPRDLHPGCSMPLYEADRSATNHTAVLQELNAIKNGLTALQQSSNRTASFPPALATIGNTLALMETRQQQEAVNQSALLQAAFTRINTALADIQQRQKKQRLTQKKCLEKICLIQSELHDRYNTQTVPSLSEIKQLAEQSVHRFQTDLAALRNACSQPFASMQESAHSTPIQRTAYQHRAPTSPASSDPEYSESEESEDVEIDVDELESTSGKTLPAARPTVDIEDLSQLPWRQIQNKLTKTGFTGFPQKRVLLKSYIAALEGRPTEGSSDKINRAKLEIAVTYLNQQEAEKTDKQEDILEWFTMVDKDQMRTSAKGVYNRVQEHLDNLSPAQSSKRRRNC